METNFEAMKGSFAETIAETRARILARRVDLTPENTELIVNANAPSEFIPPTTDHGILLVHGLYDSPYSLLSLFERLKATDRYHLRTLLLPGHGTVPSDLLTVTLEEWMAAFRFAVKTFPPTIKTISVIGHSTGGGLGLEAIHDESRIDRLVLIAPPIRIKNGFAPYAHYYRAFSWLFPRLNWYQQSDENNFAKYQSITFNSVVQVSRLADELAIISYPKPILMVLSNEDEVISTQAALDYLTRQPNTRNQALLYSGIPQTDVASNVSVVNSQNLSEHILDYSHNCLPNAPDHPYYGKHGGYKGDHHYQSWWGKWLPHQNDPEIYYGAISLGHLKQYHLNRLTYNPQFDVMLERILTFISEV